MILAESLNNYIILQDFLILKLFKMDKESILDKEVKEN